MRQWGEILLILLAFLAVMAGQAAVAAGHPGKLAPADSIGHSQEWNESV